MSNQQLAKCYEEKSELEQQLNERLEKCNGSSSK